MSASVSECIPSWPRLKAYASSGRSVRGKKKMEEEAAPPAWSQWERHTKDVAYGLQCYSCNIISGARYIDKGCTSPEVVTCSHSHKGFKQRFCIKTESVVLGKLLTSGCATSRHCQQQELPGVRIHCCDTDLCNRATHPSSFSLLLGLLWMICFLF